MEKDINILVFSKNRALQLDLCLNSFYKRCLDFEFANIYVLYKVDNLFKISYKVIQKEHPNINMIKEIDFRQNLLDIISNKKYILFLTDDSIFCNDFSLREIIELLEENEKILGFSFRLGLNTRYCYPLDKDQNLPTGMIHSNNIFIYYWPNAEYDYGYPLELSSSLYYVKDIMKIVKLAPNISNPNVLESILDYFKNDFKENKNLLACYYKSVAFANPINKVQKSAYLNRSGVNYKYSPENLLTMYEDGVRINPDKFQGLVTNAAHMEIDLI